MGGSCTRNDVEQRRRYSWDDTKFILRILLRFFVWSCSPFIAENLVQVVRLKSSLTLEVTHKRLHGALDTFNSQMMTKHPPPVARAEENSSHIVGKF